MTVQKRYVEQVVDAWEEGYKKGLLTFWVLLSLHNGDKHMQQIKLYIEAETSSNLTVDEKSLYRSLTRFRKMELVTTYDMPSQNGGPPLKVYGLAPPGHAALKLFYERNIAQVFLTKQFDKETKGL